jgi:hypothetical protein
MLLSEDDTAGDIFECKIGNLPAGDHKNRRFTKDCIANMVYKRSYRLGFAVFEEINYVHFVLVFLIVSVIC